MATTSPACEESFTSSSSSSSSSSDSDNAPYTPSCPPKESDITLILHSPTGQLSSTPFATHCGITPFEYPFPISSTTPSTESSLFSSSLAVIQPNSSGNSASRAPSPVAPSFFASSDRLSDSHNALVLSLSMGVPTTASNSPSSDGGGSPFAGTQHHQYKMRTGAAPVPPALVERRRNLERGASNGSTDRGEDGRDAVVDVPAAEGVAAAAA